MCGIVGYIGQRNCVPIILEGLRRLEYRGYDSAGIALIRNGGFFIQKKAGKVADLAGQARGGRMGPAVGRSAWGTRAGRRTASPTTSTPIPHWDREEADRRHPQRHHRELSRDQDEAGAGRAHVPGRDRHRGPGAPDRRDVRAAPETSPTAVRLALSEVEGTYGLVVLSPHEPDKMIAARKGSPLIIGVGEGENFVASDAAAIVEHTRQVVYLDDGEVAEITARRVPDDHDRRRRRSTKQVEADHPRALADRAGRLRSLHAEGDPRAARDDPERDARAAAGGRGECRPGRPAER